MAKNSWFKHYNTAHEGQLIGDLISNGNHEAALLVYVIMEFISRFEDEENRGCASVPINRIARAMNMKPSKIERLLGDISAVSRSDLVCETDEKQPRNRRFLMRKWLKLQENRGGKKEAKKEQNIDRSKKEEVRSKKEEVRSKIENKEKELRGSEGVEVSTSHRSENLNFEIWKAYSSEYEKRWGKLPIRNATTNAQCMQLSKRLGQDAVEVVKFYVWHNKTFYVQACHPIGIALKDAEGLHTQWSNGKQVTYGEAKQIENKQNVVNAFASLLSRENENGK